MKFRSTWVMAAAVGLLAAYTIYDFKNSEDGDDSKETKRVFYLLRDDLKEIQVTGKDGDILLKKDGEAWTQLKPVEDLAESSAVEGFIYTLLTQKGKVFQESKDPKWAEFALDAPKWTVVLKGAGKTEKLEVSAKNAYDGSYYIRVGNELWLGDRGLAQLLEREPMSFRSRKIYRGPEDVRSVQVELDYGGSKDSYSLAKTSGKDGDHWTMTPDPGFPLDAFKVSSWVQKLTSAHGTDFFESGERGKPTMEIKLDEWVISMTQGSGPDVIVSTNKNPVLYKMGASALDHVRVPKIFFRDGKLPFRFALEKAQGIEVHSDKLNEVFIKKDQEWALKNAKAGAKLDQEKLVQLIQSVQNLEAAEFPGDTGREFKGPPQFAVRDGEGKLLFGLEMGAEYKPKYGFNKGQTLRYARVMPSKEIVGLPKDRLDRLIDSAIIKK